MPSTSVTRRISSLIFCAFLGLGASCDASPSGQAPSGDAAISTSPEAGPAIVGQVAPNFSAPLLSATEDGQRLDLQSLRGKVVLLDFWASWCEPCKIEMPELEALYQRYRDQGFVVVGINVDEKAENAQSFFEALRPSFPIVLDNQHQIAKLYDPPGMPTSYLIDKNGVLLWKHAGYQEGDEEILRAKVQAAVEAK